jgi:hypothetical protein
MTVQTSSEKSVACENGTLASILQKIAYAVLRMAWRMERFHSDTLADFPCLDMGRCLCDRLTIFAADYLQVRKVLELY